MKATRLLKEDHDQVRALFREYESAGENAHKQKQGIVERVFRELEVHTKIEEEIFYPACEGKIEEDMLKEAKVEHDSAKLLIAEIEAGDGQSDDYFDAKVQVLSEQIEHHVEEEEKELFAEVRKADIDLKELGRQMAQRKRELMKEYRASGTPRPDLQTMDEVQI